MSQPAIMDSTAGSTMGAGKSEPIAIVGSGCRLPGGVRSPSQLWDLLKKPRDLLGKISPAARFHTRAFYHPNGDHHGTANVSQCYLFDEDPRAFDHEFFGIHAGEAEAIDPQQRILLEVVYEAVCEAAGYSLDSLRGSQTGVFVGQMTDDYRDTLYRDVDNVSRYAATGISRAITANRVSYVFDWHGPSVSMDTACSSSLVALHQAVQALRNGESTLAVAAGVNLILGPEMFVIESKLHMLSPTARCRMWDASADGYARGEGIAAVVLKPLRQALADGNHIECVIRETGVNQDGRTPGLTVPSAVSQAALIKSTYARAGLNPADPRDRCQYFEAHGTGTAAGDPKEAQAIRDVFFPRDEKKKTDDRFKNQQESDVLYVGSVKTVLGHSEGAAGLVAVLKASLAVQHAVIPPNMHFERLSPAVEPFYYPHLRVPTEARPWPGVDPGSRNTTAHATRRVSVNSFGFGGTNAHAIIESWDDNVNSPQDQLPMNVAGEYGPFTISAHSPEALKRQVAALSERLRGSRSDDSLTMGDLAWTLRSRRTEFPYRASFSASTKQDLVAKLETFLSQVEMSQTLLPAKAIPVSPEFPLRILAVFTGQGAQWPRMGASLFEQSPVFRQSIQQLDESLGTLPDVDDAPDWLLADALLAPPAASRVHEAVVAQPLTTALQIALVDLLKAIGLHVVFGAAVGHSSGEIAAAYASGYLSASDAIRIAYYRGLHASRARGGSMMAVGMSLAEAKTFCEDINSEAFQSSGRTRITVAASNSPSSVTLSGDTDAIHEAKAVLDRRGTFARVLQVDTAYHSHHMQACVEAYSESLVGCAIQPQHHDSVGNNSSCEWFSSVHGADGRSIGIDSDALRGRYWIENMARPVLFHEAVERAVREDDRCFDLVLEIGPHATLRGPVTDALKKLTGTDIPYTSLLKRGEDDRVAFSDALGRLWTNFRSLPGMSSVVYWAALREAVYGRPEKPQILKDLPTYAWDHERPLFFESRKSKAWRTSGYAVHPLLGRVTQDGNNRDGITMTWRNILKLGELEWLRGHQFQHQVVFPAAGYVSMATDAACALAEAAMSVSQKSQQSASLVELTNLRFHRAITLDDTSAIELTCIIRSLSMRRSGQDGNSTVITADYECYSANASARPDRMDTEEGRNGVIGATTTVNFSGQATIRMATMSDSSPPETLLPARLAPNLPLSKVDASRFYSWTSSIGLQYSGDFLVESIQRRRNLAEVVLKQPNGGDHDGMRVHPATLDMAFHGIFAAHSFPGDGGISTPHLPSTIDRVRVAVAGSSSCTCRQISSPRLVADCHIRDHNENQHSKSSSTAVITGDVDLFCATCERPTLQVEGLTVSRLSKPSPRDDRSLFARTVWGRDLQTCGIEAPVEPSPKYQETRAKLSEACDRTAYFYLRQLCSLIGPSPPNGTKTKDPPGAEWHIQCLIQWAFHIISRVTAGRHPRLRAEWTNDTPEMIESWKNKYVHELNHAEMNLIHTVGQRLPSLVLPPESSPQKEEDTEPILDTLMREDMLPRLYHRAEGFHQANDLVGRAVGQLAHRYPSMRILEIGGGTGAATIPVLGYLGDEFASYTFTDVSAAFFREAQAKFDGISLGAEKMRYAVLDIEQDPREYPDGSEVKGHVFDLVIASNVLHATRSLAQTLANCRRLLAPGGFLVLDEVTSDTLWGPFVVSALPGWWLGSREGDAGGDGRVHGPLVNEREWDRLLKENGFSGVDHVARDTRDDSTYMFSVMVSQAVDPRVDLLRSPLVPRGATIPSQHATPEYNHLGDIVIIGGEGGGPAAGAAGEMKLLLEPITRPGSITVLDGWEPLEEELELAGQPESPIVSPGAAVICLSALDDKVDAETAAQTWQLSEARLRALQAIFRDASRVLCVTQGARSSNPCANMMIGLGRTVMCESPHLRILFVDIEDDHDVLSVQPRLNGPDLHVFLAESFLRMALLDKQEYSDVLWTNETELSVRMRSGSGSGQQVEVSVPRVKPDELLNRRLASASRRVEQQVTSETISTGGCDVEISSFGNPGDDGGRLSLRQVRVSAPDCTKGSDAAKTSPTHLKSLFSSLFAFVPKDGSESSPLYICLAAVVDKPEQMAICISNTNASSLRLPEGQFVVIPGLDMGAADTLFHCIITTIVCESLLADLSGTLWLHDAPAEIVETISQMDEARGCVFFSTSAPSYDRSTAITFIHPQSSRRQLEASIPSNVRRLFLMDQGQETDISRGLANIDIRYLCQDIKNGTTVRLGLDTTRLWEMVTNISGSTSPAASGTIGTCIDLGSISSISGSRKVTSIVDWTEPKGTKTVTGTVNNTRSVPVQIQPLGFCGESLFSPHKTYLLVGLAGDLGMSLVEWMASKGARHFAIASRNPQIDDQILRYLRKQYLGVDLRAWALDVADKSALLEAHAEMVAQMPPIGGVANGAMVLRDRPFGNMTVEDFEAVLRPKAMGTVNLDELFSTDRSLEFFILFASGTCVVGNAGQANYSAANMFMATVAEQRRSRGVAASVIYLGTLLGVGHVARSLLLEKENSGTKKANNTRSVETQLRRFSSLPLSETDLHTAFAEAVASGRPDSGMDPGLIVGLGDGKDAPWQSLPRFSSWLSHLSRRRQHGGGGDGEGEQSHRGMSRQDQQQQQRASLRDELAVLLDTAEPSSSAALPEKASKLLQDAFATKLGVILQTPASKIDKTMPLVALGFDSLVAVEVRSWILKELVVDVPILKMLGGSSLVDVCRNVVAEFAENHHHDRVSEGSVESESSTDSPLSDSSYDGEEDPGTSTSVSTPHPPRPAPSVLVEEKKQPDYVRVGDMSPAQARLYFLHQYLEDKSAYNVGYVGRYHGHLDVERLQKAVWRVCMIHESLRSCYFMDTGASHRAVQAVLPSPRPMWGHREVQDESQVWQERDVQKGTQFDIEHGSLVKVTVLSQSPVLHHIIFLHHHIALDGIGWFLFFRDLERAYSGHQLVLPPQQSIDMSMKQLKARNAHDDMQPLLAFWDKMHRNPHDPLPLFAFSKVKNRKVLNKYETETTDMELDPHLARRVKQTAAALGVTPFHFYLSALVVFLTRCLDEARDFSIGIVDANRPDVEDRSTMGYFLNMLPLRFRMDDNKKPESQRFDELVQWCRDTVFEAQAARAPFDAILDQVQTSRSGSHHPLFQVALDYRQGYSTEDRFGPGTIEWDSKQSITCQNPYDIFINVTQASPGDHTYIHWTTQKYMYSASDSTRMMTWYTRILVALARDPASPIDRCPVANEADLEYAMELGAGKPVDQLELDLHGWDNGSDTLLHQVDRTCQKYPGSVALVDSHGGRLTYAEMMSRTQYIARCLRQVLESHNNNSSVSPEPETHHPAVIGTLVHPANDYVCTLLAILRLGLTCIGPDLRNPEERLAVMLSNCAPSVLICTAETRDQAHRLAASISAQVLDLDLMDMDHPPPHMTEPVQNTSSLDQRAVILYTSGSTGVPKGVLLSHRNLYSHIRANTALFGLNRNDVILQQTSPGFDFCLDQIFHALANGGTLVVAGREVRGDPSGIAQLMLDHDVTITVGCPSEYLALLNYGLPTLRRCARWRLAFSGGEKLTVQLRHGFRKLRLADLQFVNVYGPTEVTIACARGRVPYQSDDDLAVQQSDYLYPMPGYAMLVLDKEMNPLPAGFPGEVYIAGDGVALGYLKRPEETQRRFLEWKTPLPGLTRNGIPSTRLYRSGDHGRLLQDGSIHLLGRVEDGSGSSGQVKIRGMRVELDEVANTMIRESRGALTAAAVSYRRRGDSGDGMLVGFVVFALEKQDPEHEDQRRDIIRRLRTSLPLPPHMCPSVVVPVEKLPTNVNGKLDRAAVDKLPIATRSGQPLAENNNGDIVDESEPSTPLEQRMKQVWRETLDLTSLPPSSLDNINGEGHREPTIIIDPDSDFFQVGGSSMLAIKLRAVIRGTFGVVVSLPELFRLRTLARMAAWVGAAQEQAQNGQASYPGHHQVPSTTMDWAAEVAALFDGLSSTSLPSRPPTYPKHDIKVLLTGATGFLGTHILHHLITDPRVSKVHCVATRRRPITIPSDKIVSHPGDLASPLLGLSHETFTSLSQTIDVIIHNGARVSFLEDYGAALRAPNALSVRSLCTLALPRRVPLHFISTASVAGVLPRTHHAAGGSMLPPVSVADYPPDNNKNHKLDGYTLSKWVGEALLEKVSSELGLPTYVHRVASLVGQDDAPQRDIMDAVIRFSRAIGSVPALGESPDSRGKLHVQGAFDWIPVERVGEDVARDALLSVLDCSPSFVDGLDGTLVSTMKFVHHCSEKKVVPNRLRGHLEAVDGRPFGEMEVGEWLDAARSEGLDLALYEYLYGVANEGGDLYLPTLCK
ncbi:Nonribosomal peptide synthetase 14 [Rhypophila decipiens]|uniref:Nonribosomal peptide synthetase 14 n=1 Tax=Rhypophila decipiens TaxID=261697 RepID=A0AAN6YG60_9PEZI|nr:Nonribosomal peptide synthetase 14 [Rhypophila decipiens]